MRFPQDIPIGPDYPTFSQTAETIPPPGDTERAPPRSLTPLSGVPAVVPPADPKRAAGSFKIPASALSRGVVAELGVGVAEGAWKYGRHNFRESDGLLASTYYDATMRHLDAWWEGEDIDPESGLSHVTKAMASLAILRDGMITGQWIDDRPPPLPPEWQRELNKLYQKMRERLRAVFGDPKPPHVHKSIGSP